jgi:hypothetical protein
MKWREAVLLKNPEARAMAAILIWVLLYFNACRFALIQGLAVRVSLTWKLVCFCAFLGAAMYTVNGIYKGVLCGRPRLLPPIWFAVDFTLSMVFAITWANEVALFWGLSLLVVVFDMSLFWLRYSRKFKRLGP